MRTKLAAIWRLLVMIACGAAAWILDGIAWPFRQWVGLLDAARDRLNRIV